MVHACGRTRVGWCTLQSRACQCASSASSSVGLASDGQIDLVADARFPDDLASLCFGDDLSICMHEERSAFFRRTTHAPTARTCHFTKAFPDLTRLGSPSAPTDRDRMKFERGSGWRGGPYRRHCDFTTDGGSSSFRLGMPWRRLGPLERGYDRLGRSDRAG